MPCGGFCAPCKGRKEKKRKGDDDAEKGAPISRVPSESNGEVQQNLTKRRGSPRSVDLPNQILRP